MKPKQSIEEKYPIGTEVNCYQGPFPFKAKVIGYNDDEFLCLSSFLEFHVTQSNRRVHPKAVRKIVKKKPLREWWVNIYSDDGAVIHPSKERADRSSTNSSRLECVLVREVREKK